MTVRYVFADDEPLRIMHAKHANAQVMGEAIAAISIERGGAIKPADIVLAARETEHPLHPFFEWDDTSAAHKYRLDQARHIIRIVRIEDDTVARGSERAFLSVNAGTGNCYHPIEAVKRSASLQKAVLERAKRDLEGFEHRYAELRDICELVMTARKRVQRKIAESESRVAA